MNQHEVELVVESRDVKNSKFIWPKLTYYQIKNKQT